MKTILSTKKLKPNQRELLLNAGVRLVEYNAITITPVPFEIPTDIKNVIITSQNGAKAIINAAFNIRNLRFFCVGKKTAAFLEKNGAKVVKIAQSGAALAQYIVKNYRDEKFTYFCGKQRRDELPTILKQASMTCNEVIVYETNTNTKSFDRNFDGVLFFSPSGVNAFAKANKKPQVAFCIGETTATEGRKHFDTVIVSNATTIESTIAKAVKYFSC